MEKAILRTLVYHDLFDYPLTFGELYRLLIINAKRKPSSRAFGPSSCRGAQVEGTQNAKLQRKAKNLIEKGKIGEKDNFYFLKDREEIVKLRKRREKYSRKKLAIAKRVVKWLRWVPTIKMIGVTGAVAVSNAKKSDDIDLLMITASGRVWLTRILAVLLMEVLGKRRRPADKKVRDKICLNIFLDEDYLRMPKGKRNLFVAHEIGQMRVLFEKDEVYQKFLRENKWVRNFLANSVDTRQVTSDKKKEKRILLRLLDFFEKVAYWGQLRYMKSKKTTEQVSLYFAFFHPKDVGERVMRKYRKKISNF